MATINIKLRDEQLIDIAFLGNLPNSDLLKIINAIKAAGTILKPVELEEIIKSALNCEEDFANKIVRQLISAYSIMRQGELSAIDFVKSLHKLFTENPKEYSSNTFDNWEKSIDDLEKLLSLESIWVMVKALDLSYEYTNILQNLKIITDIRPVFNKEADNIDGAVISYKLRINFIARGKSENLAIAIDEKDVKDIMASCQRALKKAKTAKIFMVEVGKIPSFICGDDSI